MERPTRRQSPDPATDFVRCAGPKLGVREEDFLRRLFGWRRADGGHRFERAWLEMASLVDRAELGSALALYFLAGTGERGTTITVTGPTRAWQSLQTMVESSPSLAKVLEVNPIEHHVVASPLDSKIEFLVGRDPDSVAVRWDGRQPLAVNFVAIGDPRVQESTVTELHYKA